MSKDKGLTITELLLALAIFSMIVLIIVRLYIQTQKSIIKSQQLTNLQQLAKVSLNEIARDIRQSLEVRTSESGDIPVGSNFNLSSDGSNQLCIFVPKLSNLRDRGISDRIIYKLDTYNGNPNRLIQQLSTFTRDATGNIIGVDHSAIPITHNIDLYRANPTGATGGPLIELFNNSYYSYDYINFYWDYDSSPEDPRGIMAIGLTVSVKDARGIIQNRLTLTTVVTSRPITGVPR